MATGSVKHKQRRTKGGLSSTEVSRALIATAALGAILLLAFFVTAGSYFSAERQAKTAVAKITPLLPSSGGEARSPRCVDRGGNRQKGALRGAQFRQSHRPDRVIELCRLRRASRR